MYIPEQGVGIIYFPGFEDTVELNSDLISTIEIEPQTLWLHDKTESGSYYYDRSKVTYLQTLNKSISFHGVGFPVGGSITSDTEHIECMQNMISTLDPVWLSEHLSFNRIYSEGSVINTNFLLPPLQTMEGVLNAAKKIIQYAAHFELPFAFETGTNYLKPQEFEITDGQFINEVAKHADCYILLDIHNLLSNQKNGRQNIFDALSQIDLNRIIQVHLAGGFYFDGYYLDSHSGVSSTEVLEVFEKIVRMLPNLKGITFEMLSDYLPSVSNEDIRKQLEIMNFVWDCRGKDASAISAEPLKNKSSEITTPRLKDYERELGLLGIRKKNSTDVPSLDYLNHDKGVKIIQSLTEKFRKSQLVSFVKLSSRYIMLKYGEEVFEQIFSDYCVNNYPCLFASDNGILFSEYLLKDSDLVEKDTFLRDLVSYEYNSLLTYMDGTEREIEISFNPYDIISSLELRKLPTDFSTGNYIIQITPEERAQEKVDMVFHS